MAQDGPGELDRAILQELDSGWVSTPEYALTEDELNHVLGHFGVLASGPASELRSAVTRIFRSLIQNVLTERFRQSPDGLEEAPKPSTIVVREMAAIHRACTILEGQLNRLDKASRAYIDLYLEQGYIRDSEQRTLRAKQLIESLYFPIDHLITAAQLAEGQTARGPQLSALRIMVKSLANWWEHIQGQSPSTDKGRGQRADPFLELCTDVAGIAHRKLNVQGAGLGSLNLSGIVADVIEKRAKD